MRRNLLEHIRAADASTFASGMAWYDVARATVTAIASDAGVRLSPGVVGAFAALSPRVSYQENVRLFRNLLERGPDHVACLRASVTSALACLERDAYPTGRKVRAFAGSIMGEDAVCLDTWALRAAGVSDQPSSKVFASVESAYRAVAKDVGIQPRQAQAVIWCHIRGSAW